MKVDDKNIIDAVKIGRGIYVASLATFIFTSMFAISLANSGALNEVSTASVIKANYHNSLANIAQVDNENSGGGSPSPVKGEVTDPIVAPVAAPDSPKAFVAISSTPVKATASGITKIYWKSENVSTCVVKKDGENFSTLTSSSGLTSGKLIKDTKFTVECTGDSGQVVSSITVTTVASQVAPTVEFDSNALTVNYNDETTIGWKVSNAKSCTLKKDGKYFLSKLVSVSAQDTKTGKLTKNTKFTVECSGQGGLASASMDITVKPLEKPTAKITVDKVEISKGEAVNISWSSKDATKCVVMNGSKLVSSNTSGSALPVLNESTVFWMSCSNLGGSVVDAVPVQVSAPSAGAVISPKIIGGTSDKKVD